MSFPTIVIVVLIISLASFIAYKIYVSNKIALNRSNAWPEVLDLIIASLQSGASISESLSTIGKVGPVFVREPFLIFATKIESGERFEEALNYLKNEFADPISDQLLEALYFASMFGSSNSIKVLRELSEYVSSDLALRGEIQIRFGWIKNSANLAAVAPWLLFLILRSQENAREAYAQEAGQFIIILGVLMTFLAYLWMQKIARLPKSKRLFTLEMSPNE
ncbi:MAG: type II secretion system F family protein [Candidatus Nanopelagicus sp.]